MTSMEELVKEWLASKGASMWADWYISEPDRLELAAKWFAEQLEEFQAWFLETYAPL